MTLASNPESHHQQNPCGDLVPGAHRVRLDQRHRQRTTRLEMVRWLSSRCGRPDRQRGLWWTEEQGQVVCFLLPEHFMEFSLAWF